MIWYIIAVLFFACALSILIYTRLRDRRYERMKVSEAMAPEVREDIEEEEKGLAERHEKFRKTLEAAKGGKELG